MIPMKTSSVFKSRWMALIWAAGIIWFAYDFAGSAPDAESGNKVTNGASADNGDKVAQALGN